MPVANTQDQMQLITLDIDSSTEHAVGSCCSAQLVQEICRRLLHPCVPLSDAAAVKLQQQQGASSSATAPAAGVLLRSLPVELLYDDAGLELFDQITQVCKRTSRRFAAMMAAEWTAQELHLSVYVI
jgi:hypothetical protein